MSCPADIHVAVGVIENGTGELLIAYRHPHLHQGGLWEFPGGKVEPGETVQQALRRELSEELGIDVVAASPMMKVRHRYPDRQVMLDVWRVQRFRGEPCGIAGQPIRWVAPEDLPNYPFPIANRPIISAARLPDAYAILDDSAGDVDVLFEKLQQFVERGLRLIQLRARSLTVKKYLEFAQDAADYCRSRGMSLLLNAQPDLVLRVGAAGVHLNSCRLMALKERPLAENLWVAASCHNLGQLQQAERSGVDFVVLSPVLATPSHPDATVLGWSRFAQLVAQINLPVFALGGMRPSDLGEAKRHGAQGIAAIRGFCVGGGVCKP